MSKTLKKNARPPLRAAGSKTLDPRATTCPLGCAKVYHPYPEIQAGTSACLHHQTATLTKLKLATPDHSDDEFSLDLPYLLNNESRQRVPVTVAKSYSPTGEKGNEEVEAVVVPPADVPIPDWY